MSTFFEVSISRQTDGTYAWQGEPDPTAPYESQAECLADMTQADEIVSLDEALEMGLIVEDPRGKTQDESFMENPTWFVGIDGESPWIFAVCSREVSFDDQNRKLLEFDESFDSSDPKSCEERGILLLKNRRAQMIEQGFIWPFDIESSRWPIQQAMLNRPEGESLMSSVIRYVEGVESQAEAFNGIE